MDFGTGPVCIRAMTGADLERIVEIAETLETAPQWGRGAYETAIAAAQPRIALVAETDGMAAGFAVARVVAGVAEIESIAVVREAQRRGVGRALLAELIERLKAIGVTEIDLEVRESNRAAAALYARAGFREVGRRREYYRDPDEDALLLRLTIGGEV